jgi:hypothetical protein
VLHEGTVRCGEDAETVYGLCVISVSLWDMVDMDVDAEIFALFLFL